MLAYSPASLRTHFGLLLQTTPRKKMGTPVRMMMTPTPHTIGSEMKLKTSRKAQKTKYATGIRRFTWGASGVTKAWEPCYTLVGQGIPLT